MSTSEQNKPVENPTQKAFRVMSQIFEDSSPSIPQKKGVKHIKKLGDGATISTTKYLTREIMDRPTGGATYAIMVKIFRPHVSFLWSFVITENGLVSISTGRKSTVTLRSLLYPTPGEDLQVTYEGSESAKPLTAFRSTSAILVSWVKEMVDEDKLLPCPVTITEKKAKR